MKKATYVIILSLLPLLLYQNCGKPTELEYSAALDLDSQAGVQDAAVQIMNKHCASCHSATNMSGNVGDLNDVEYLVYSRLVVPGEPELSPIIIEISQGRMPAEGPSLTGAEVDVLKNWIKNLRQDTTGDGGAVGGVTPIEPKFSVLFPLVWDARCKTCHANRTYKFDSYANVVKSVIPGNAANSIMYQAITVGRTGGKMPQGGSLSSAQVKAIEDWINQGAQNN